MLGRQVDILADVDRAFNEAAGADPADARQCSDCPPRSGSLQ